MKKYFIKSPFILTANKEVADHWAGRPNTLSRIERIKSSFHTSFDSSLDLVWANFGSGKTHTLWHLTNLLEKESDENLVIYVEMPEQVKNFKDLYKRIISQLPMETIAKKLISCDHSLLPKNLQQASRILIHGSDDEKSIVVDWINAGRPHLRELKGLTNITTRIEDDEAALQVFSGIVAAINFHSIRMVLLIDDFQRTTLLKENVRNTILSYIRTLFSKHPENLSIIFAAATRAENTALQLFPSELRTIMGMKPSISLPEFSKDEALDFVCRRFQYFRPKGYNGNFYDPIGENSVNMVINFISESQAKLIPRSILQALHWIFDHMIANNLTELSSEETNILLKELETG
jgi:hypothetical protein